MAIGIMNNLSQNTNTYVYYVPLHNVSIYSMFEFTWFDVLSCRWLHVKLTPDWWLSYRKESRERKYMNYMAFDKVDTVVKTAVQTQIPVCINMMPNNVRGHSQTLEDVDYLKRLLRPMNK